MDVMNAIWAGLLGTAAMTALMYLAPRMGMPKMDILGMLGTMLTESTSAAYALGAVMHFMMGAIFAVVYAWLWSLGLGAAVWTSGIVFGLVHGVIAAVTMPLMIRVHPRPPKFEMSPAMIAGLLMGHAVFGLVVALAYTG